MAKSKLPIQAVGHRVIILVDDISDGDRQQKEGHVILTHSTDDYEREREFQERGAIVDIGPSAYNLSHHDKAWVKIGDRVLYKKYDGHKFLDEETGKLYRIVNDEDIIAKVT